MKQTKKSSAHRGKSAKGGRRDVVVNELLRQLLHREQNMAPRTNCVCISEDCDNCSTCTYPGNRRHVTEVAASK
jgi:hypothetical protein